MTDPLFDSAHAALCFAFRYSGQQYEPTVLARMMRGSIGNGKGLVGLSGAAQAGFIRAEVELLIPWEKNAVIARFAVERSKEVLAARIEMLTPAASALETGVTERRLVDNLVQKFYGSKVYLKDLAAKRGVHPSTITRKWVLIRAQLTKIEHRAIDRVEAKLQQIGVVA